MTTPVTTSILLEQHDVHCTRQTSLVELPQHQTGIISTIPCKLDRADLTDILLQNNLTPESTQCVGSPMLSTSSVEPSTDFGKQSATIEQSSSSLLSTNITATTAFSLPGIMSLSTFTASSFDNNNVSINCSFTNSSVDSRDDEAYGLHVTFDEDNRPQLRSKDGGSQLSVGSTGFEFMRIATSCTATKKSASMEIQHSEIPRPAASQIANIPVLSGLVSEMTSSMDSETPILPEVTCIVSSSISHPVQASCTSKTSSCIISEESCSYNSAPVVPEAGSSISTVVDSVPQKDVNHATALPDGGSIEGEKEPTDKAFAQEVPTASDHTLVSSETTSHSDHDLALNSACKQSATCSSASSKIDRPLVSSNTDGKLDCVSDLVGPEAEPGFHAGKSSSTSAPVTPVRKSVRTHKNPLNTAEFVSLDISPRSRAKTATASKRLSLDNSTTAKNAPQTIAGTRATRSLPFTQPQNSKPSKELAKTRRSGSTTVEGENATTLKQKSLMPEQLPVTTDPKTATSGLSSSLPTEPPEFKRKRGRPRKNPVAVNGKTGVHHEGMQLATAGSWSLLNSKAAGDSSLGSIGLVSELFSVTPFTPMSSQSSLPTSNDTAVSKEVSTPADKSDTLPLPSESQSPIADLSFAMLDEVSSFDQKHKKKKKKKKKKKSRHSSLADVCDGDCKVVGNLDDLIAALQSVQMSATDVATGQFSQQSESSTSSDGSRILAKIFSQSSFNQNAAMRFAVHSRNFGCSGNSSVAVVSGNRSKISKKALTLVGGTGHIEARQSCLPPKKRHKLQMAHNVPHAVDTGRVQATGRGRRGRPPKLRSNHHSQKLHMKASKFCSKSFCLLTVVTLLLE